MKMDKYETKCDLVLDIIDHPDRYTSEQLKNVLSDPETAEIYNLLCKIDSAIEIDNTVDIDAEWNAFAGEHILRPSRRSLWPGSWVASIVAIIGISVAAVASGIIFTVVVTGGREDLKEELAETTAIDTVSACTLAAKSDTVLMEPSPVIFENTPLETVMEKIGVEYSVEVRFNTKETACLHLYYKLDPTLSIDEVIAQLNTFEQINIKRNGNLLIIE